MGPDKPKDLENEEGTTKNAAKKAAKKEAKAAKRAEHKASAPQTQQDSFTGEDDVSKGKYGNLPLIRSEGSPPSRVFVNVTDLKKELVGEVRWLRARLHAVRGKGKQCFAVLRQREATVQAIVCVSDNVSKQMVKFTSR